jgi:hypothetical protein
LTNGYVEDRRVFGPRGEIEIRQREYPPGAINIIRANDFHKVTLRDPSRGCWTLFFAWRHRTQDWGFWHPDTGVFVPADDHRRMHAAAGSSGDSPEHPPRPVLGVVTAAKRVLDEWAAYARDCTAGARAAALATALMDLEAAIAARAVVLAAGREQAEPHG